MHFEEMIKDQGEKLTLDLEIGRSSFYPEDSIYIRVGEQTVIATAKRFSEAVESVGQYHGFLE